ncbi:alpha/beta hydrolase family protein [Asticcacaulis benevestitus]|uniref:AB hydrolase-1 domain-containing protein n=1 Tax=Asticcacaulis benevestitus DSM 16100 = ATCC BAA-896 TaxID=1121022 RepID=V4Q386_9CAUL|nr:alpha/beta hydrolase [Asticcacaulis benevestitus]ESQ94144.1 hypothetical protein ABENE_03370 [Asticcacaulis benevestitus DSM 16100 = ATCC BAA-896]
MRKFFLMLTALMGLAAPVCAEEAAGDWSGMLVNLRVGLHLTKDSDGHYAGFMQSLDQGGVKIPLDSIAATPDTLAYHGVNAKLGVDGRYEGHWDDAQKAWVGNWRQGGLVPLTFKRTATADMPFARRPQEEAIATNPHPFPSEDVGFDNASAGVHLAGTFSKPVGAGPLPAVVLISGSGRNTRDEEGYGHKAFVVLADALNRAGIAVLRYDKRGAGQSTGDYDAATTADFAADAEAAVTYLASRSDVDPKHVGLVGHSEGGIIAPIVAGHLPSVSFAVLIAGVTVPGDQAALLQLEALDRANGKSETEIRKQLALLQQAYAVIRASKNPEDARTQLTTAARPLIESGAYSQSQADDTIALFTSPSRYWLLRYDPAVDLQNVHIPVLAIYGTLDLQVPPAGHVPALRAGLKDNPDVTIVELPGLNHLLQHATTGAPAEYARIEETIAPEALKVITEWVTRHTNP